MRCTYLLYSTGIRQAPTTPLGTGSIMRSEEDEMNLGSVRDSDKCADEDVTRQRVPRPAWNSLPTSRMLKVGRMSCAIVAKALSFQNVEHLVISVRRLPSEGVFSIEDHNRALTFVE